MDIEEAMNQAREFNTKKELIDYIKERFGNHYKLDTLSCEHYCFDERINWDSFVLCADTDEYKQQAILFTDSPLDNLK